MSAMSKGFRFMFSALLTALVPCLAAGAQGRFPPLAVEISAEHPLFVFQDGNAGGASPGAHGAGAVAHWTQLPEAVRPYSTMLVAASADNYRELLAPFQQSGVPVVARLTDESGGGRMPLSRLEDLLSAFTMVRGVEVRGMAFDLYDPALADGEGVLPDARWLMDTVRLAASYGRFVMLSLEGMAAPRMAANRNTAPLLAVLAECRDYVIPVALQRGPHTIPAAATLMGLWMTGTVSNWGVAPDARWYADARFREPGVFGPDTSPDRMPAGFYRAMLLNGAMTGAAVYTFTRDRDLWFGATPQSWTLAILPTLQQLIEGGFVARRDFAAKRAPAAMQLAPASTPAEFEANLRELDLVHHQGNLILGAYGAERPGQIPELVPNRGDRYWVPVLPAQAPQGSFVSVTRPGAMATAAQWSELQDRHHPPAQTGQAFVTRVGRGVFVMNTRENVIERQAFSVPDLPAPVRGFSARRDGAAVTLSWPFREGDVAYNVFRRVPPETHFTLLAKGLDQRQFTDPAPPVGDQAVAYAVSALTGEKEPLTGEAGYGEFFVFSVVESRIAEEVQLTPLLAYAESVALPGFGDETARITPPMPPLEGAAASLPWWPYYGGLDETQRSAAAEIVARVEAWEGAFSAASLEGVMDLYAQDYKDDSGWGREYARRAWQWFFERCAGHRMHRQIRLWDFSAFEEGRVSVQLYALFTGAPVSDETGWRTGKPVIMPADNIAESWVTWAKRDGMWRIVETRPALPNFRDLLGHSTPPGSLPPGPDRYPAAVPPALAPL